MTTSRSPSNYLRKTHRIASHQPDGMEKSASKAAAVDGDNASLEAALLRIAQEHHNSSLRIRYQTGLLLPMLPYLPFVSLAFGKTIKCQSPNPPSIKHPACDYAYADPPTV
ncbi:hypothetical protein ACLOJK_023228 [Asimina triloba]